ncbi:MAG: Gfo/Idh/MocA family oxidoreductase, partial [Kiritimatiellae bacterium]|nr:Gfo/Idh/MocA family oxidoreductase [Kiritimatiellia bacterium]
MNIVQNGASRRDFLKGTAWMLGAAAAAGCSIDKVCFSSCGSMANFAVPPMEKVRVGFIGIGERGFAAVRRVMLFPGVEAAALCDLRAEAVDQAREWLKKNNKPGAMHEYKGKDDSWKGLCDDPQVDVVYIAAPAGLHVEMELYAMRAG